MRDKTVYLVQSEKVGEVRGKDILARHSGSIRKFAVDDFEFSDIAAACAYACAAANEDFPEAA